MLPSILTLRRYSVLFPCAVACSFAPELPDDSEQTSSSGGDAGDAAQSSSGNGTVHGQSGSGAMLGQAGSDPAGDGGVAADAGASGKPAAAGKEPAGTGGVEAGQGGSGESTAQAGETLAGGTGAEPGGGAAGSGVAGDTQQAGSGGTTTCPDEFPGCERLRAALLHRYSFGATGTVATDSVSGADGAVIGTELSGTGSLDLSGERSDQYVELPNGIVSSLSDATFEVWLNWRGGVAWQRIFDLGTSSLGEDRQEQGASYLYLTPLSGVEPNVMRVSYSLTGPTNATFCYGTQPLPTETESHVVVVVDTDNGTLSLYLNGQLENSEPMTVMLSAIDDNNNWLGRSQFVADEELAAIYDEFRIYDAPLTAEDIALSFSAGPNPVFLD